MPTPDQGEALYHARLERARKAHDEFEATGKVEWRLLLNVKAADSTTGALPGLTGLVVWSWYGPWMLKGFETRFAVIGDLDRFEYTTVPGVAELNKLALTIHEDSYLHNACYEETL